MKYNDFQMLLYVDSSHFEACKAFYQYVLGLTAFYHWDEGIEDRGIKFHAGGGVIVLLCQDNPFPEYGPIHFQLEVNDIQSVYNRVKDIVGVEITQEPFVRPYGWKMFRMKDPAGNHVNIYQIYRF